MRKGFVTLELVIGCAVIALILGGALSMFVLLGHKTIEVRRHSAAVEALANAVERLRFDASEAPAPGEVLEVALPASVARRHPGLSIFMEADEPAEHEGLKRVRITAREERRGARTRTTTLELVVRGGGT